MYKNFGFFYKNNETENDHLHMNYEKNKRAARKRSTIVDYSHVTMDIWWFLVRNSKKWRKINRQQKTSERNRQCMPIFFVGSQILINQKARRKKKQATAKNKNGNELNKWWKKWMFV